MLAVLICEKKNLKASAGFRRREGREGIEGEQRKEEGKRTKIVSSHFKAKTKLRLPAVKTSIRLFTSMRQEQLSAVQNKLRLECERFISQGHHILSELRCDLVICYPVK